VPERDVCLVVSASSWFEISEGSSAPALEQAEYRLRCRILVEGAQSIVAHIFGLADTSGRLQASTPAAETNLERQDHQGRALGS